MLGKIIYHVILFPFKMIYIINMGVGVEVGTAPSLPY